MTTDQDRATTAEAYLDEMLAAEAELDYHAWIRHFEERDIMNFAESRFRKDMYSIRADLGEYRHRVYLGSLQGVKDIDHPDRHPGCIRYVWRGVFEKNETLIVVGIHERDGTCHVNEFTYR